METNGLPTDPHAMEALFRAFDFLIQSWRSLLPWQQYLIEKLLDKIVDYGCSKAWKYFKPKLQEALKKIREQRKPIP